MSKSNFSNGLFCDLKEAFLLIYTEFKKASSSKNLLHQFPVSLGFVGVKGRHDIEGFLFFLF